MLRFCFLALCLLAPCSVGCKKTEDDCCKEGRCLPPVKKPAVEDLEGRRPRHRCPCDRCGCESGKKCKCEDCECKDCPGK